MSGRPSIASWTPILVLVVAMMSLGPFTRLDAAATTTGLPAFANSYDGTAAQRVDALAETLLSSRARLPRGVVMSADVADPCNRENLPSPDSRVATEGGVSVAAGEGTGSAPGSVVRGVGSSERYHDLFNEMKALEWESGVEHALVTMPGGEMAIVAGGETGISGMEIEN